MKRFNVNDHIYIQITEKGWKHLRETVGEEYIKDCILADGYKKEIDNQTWFRLQMHSVFDLLPLAGEHFETNVMFDDHELTLLSI